LEGIAEGTYNTKHAEAARLYYTTILLFYCNFKSNSHLAREHAEEDPERLAAAHNLALSSSSSSLTVLAFNNPSLLLLLLLLPG